MNLEGKNICVYDLEIKEEIDGKKITWGDHGLMGISVGCHKMPCLKPNLRGLNERGIYELD